MKEKLLIIFTIILTIIQNTSEYMDETVCPNLKCSSSGVCVDNYSQCPSPMNCGNDLKKVNQYTCAKSDTFLEVQKCEKYTCWNNICVDDLKFCPTMSSCPSKYLIKCHDNSCVDDLKNCPKYINCPKFLPIRCPNGDCRGDSQDCPSLTKCPKDFPILCNDNSCRMTAEECEKSAENTKCSGSSMIRCSDGTCKSSKFLCSTPKTCPIGKVLCFHGSCADKYEDCEKGIQVTRANTCAVQSENKKLTLIRCEMDGSCRQDINDCPTSVICPVERPVKCWDNSCKENIHKCPEYQKCPDDFVECANGACKPLQKSCGTLITCSWDVPFKCKDNTCKRNPNDCDNNDDCPVNKPILCWDGSCVAKRLDCSVPDSCDISTPVRCPDNQCRKSVEECREITGCPVGFIKCPDRTCKRKSSECKDVICPANFPVLCDNGICVRNKENCEKPNGCPFYSPLKCSDGSCVSDSKYCDKNSIKIKEGFQLCPDGSQIKKGSICPLENGCPTNKPNLCGNGECRVSCKIASCPSETPVKCLNGLCVITESNCPSNYDFKSDVECNKFSWISCANGLCARYPEECKPTSNCNKDMVMCEDGSCKISQDFCPIGSKCPKGKYRCKNNGTCVSTKDDCLNISGCPEKTKIKCMNNGLCVKSQEDCAAYDKKFPLANGCELEKPYKCSSGKCVVDKENCEEKLCENGYIFCTNSGKCMKSKQECRKSICDGVTCPTNGLCVDKIEKCMTLQGCNPSSPYRCLDGQCRKFPFSFNNKSESQFCSLRIECPSYRPYLCADGSCVEKSSFCRSLIECSGDKKFRCSDRTCAKSLEECKNFGISSNCPSTNPILCSRNGNCVKNYFDCFDVGCPQELPFKCISGICASSPRECVYEMTIVNDMNEMESLKNITLKTITNCNSIENTCFDGSCQEDLRLCPIFNGCNDLDFPYKCPSGKCAIDKKSCEVDTSKEKLKFYELLKVECLTDLKLCDDGICRKNCPITNSCDNKKPFLCSNGLCVKDINECAGESKCEIGKPFRCVDGTCVSQTNLCRKPKKLESSTDLKLFVFPDKDLNADILIDDSNDILGSIYIPSNAFKIEINNNKDEINMNNNTLTNNSSINNTNDFVINDNNTYINNNSGNQIISIRSLPLKTPRFNQTTKEFSESARDIVNKLFPYGDEKDQLKLEFEYAILSPVLEIKYENIERSLNQTIILNLAFDLQKYEMLSGKINQTVCLAYLDFENSTEWKCTDNKDFEKENDGKNNGFKGKVFKPAYYAIALNFVIDEGLKNNDQDWIMKNFRLFVIIIVTGMFLIFLFAYIFSRILRYRKKYIKTKFDYIEMEKKEANIKEKSTCFKGQTVRDTEDNMVFTDNPCKEEKLDQNNDSKKIRMDYLKSVEDTYFHKIKVSESNNEKLNNELDAAYERYEKLKEYSELLRQGKNLFSENE